MEDCEMGILPEHCVPSVDNIDLKKKVSLG